MPANGSIEGFGFHPIIQRWFAERFEAPTQPQVAGWPSIADGRNTLIAAPTGSGKTLTAFLACIDRLLRRAIQEGSQNRLQVVYVSPLRALSNDMQRNLEIPLREICELAASEGMDLPPIRAALRTGDTSSSQRAAIVRRPPQILVTTPESLYLMMTGPKSREVLRNVETVIIDEIHALLRDKRGSHLMLTLERLEAMCERPLQRIGLSATQKPIEQVARYLVGNRPPVPDLFHDRSEPGQDASRGGSRPSSVPCQIVDVGHGRELDLSIELPESELGAVCTHEQWEEVNARIVELIRSHRSTLIFVNTRRMAERVTHQLTELLGEDTVGSHHGSLSSGIRLETERRLKSGDLQAVVATASLELGLDIGYIDLVIQLGSPRSISTFLQRIGRSGHSLGLIPRGRLFALSRDELLECMALIRSVREGWLDTVRVPQAPLDVLAQQIVAETAARDWNPTELFDLFRRATPFHDLSRDDFDQTVQYLSEGLTDTAGRTRVFLHHDHVNQRIRARKNARLVATTNGGAIPEIGSYRVVTDPEGTVVGTLDEDFAVESSRGDIFLLGNTSWRFLGIRGGDAFVADAEGAPPSVPFWRGEAPGRTLELSDAVSRLRLEIEKRLEDPTVLSEWLMNETGVPTSGAAQIIDYVRTQKAAIGFVPSQQRVVFERFFDESGGMQLVVHAPFGGDINRAWGLAMRKRFCRSFDFELQATADDDGFILSLGPQHSFPIESLFTMLNSSNARGLLEQAILQIPLFQIRWRWNVTRALLVERMRKGQKIPPALQRFRADDLLTAVFPKLTGCQEEHTGDHEIPDHPLAQQTMHDCLHEALDLNGLNGVLDRISRGEIELIARDTREPSPFCYELLNSNPYAFLDGGEIQERRARAVATRRSLDPDSVGDLGQLDPAAIKQVVEEAQPACRDADEMHDVLLCRVFLPDAEVGASKACLDRLVADGRATAFLFPDGTRGWTCTERWPAVMVLFPDTVADPTVEVPDSVRRNWSALDARLVTLRGCLEVAGPVTVTALAERLRLPVNHVEATLQALEGEGTVLQGQFTRGSFFADQRIPSTSVEEVQTGPVEWCHRRLLARIHQLTLQGLRAQIQPVSVDAYLRFLLDHHGITGGRDRTGPNGLFEVLSMLQGLDAPAITWENNLIPARIADYESEWLDELCLTGEVGWGRLGAFKPNADRSRPIASLTRVALISLWLRSDVPWLRAYRDAPGIEGLSSPAQQILQLLRDRGALFASDLKDRTGMAPMGVDEALGELVTFGLVNADGYAGLRRLVEQRSAGRSRGRSSGRLARQRKRAVPTGRWSLWNQPPEDDDQSVPSANSGQEFVEQWAWQLLRRWGVVFRDLLTREQAAPRWFDLLQVYRRLEARGEIRGGRFIQGVAGEQFAVGDTVSRLRACRQETGDTVLVVLCAADPLNLVGILSSHPRIPSTASNQVVYANGRPVASVQSGQLDLFPKTATEWRSPIEQLLRSGQHVISIPHDAQDGDTAGDGRGLTDDQREARRRRRAAKRPLRPPTVPRPQF